MIVDRDGKSLLRLILADAKIIELATDFRGFEQVDARGVLFAFGADFLVENVFTNEDAIIADINSRPLDQFLYLRVGFAAKTAQGYLSGSRHGISISILSDNCGL